MSTKEVITSRRSCRKYQAKDIPKEIMDDIILAGRSAPTGLNRQAIKFYVIYNNVEKVKSIGLKVYENRIKAGKLGGWMDEAKPVGMQAEATQRVVMAAIFLIAYDRMSKVLSVDPDLVLSSCL